VKRKLVAATGHSCSNSSAPYGTVSLGKSQPETLHLALEGRNDISVVPANHWKNDKISGLE
jgi:hypothetical protein